MGQEFSPKSQVSVGDMIRVTNDAFGIFLDNHAQHAFPAVDNMCTISKQLGWSTPAVEGIVTGLFGAHWLHNLAVFSKNVPQDPISLDMYRKYKEKGMLTAQEEQQFRDQFHHTFPSIEETLVQKMRIDVAQKTSRLSKRDLGGWEFAELDNAAKALADVYSGVITPAVVHTLFYIQGVSYNDGELLKQQENTQPDNEGFFQSNLTSMVRRVRSTYMSPKLEEMREPMQQSVESIQKNHRR